MSVILDAHRDAQRSSVAIDDIKGVVSELGSDIKGFVAASPGVQQLARGALYKEILRRCATFGA
jgi:hypothetical protein